MVPSFQKQLKYWEIPKRSTTDPIFIAHQVMENYREKWMFSIPRSGGRLRWTTARSAQEAPLTERCSGTFDHGQGRVQELESGDKNFERDNEAGGHHDGRSQWSALNAILLLVMQECIENHLEEGPLRIIFYTGYIASQQPRADGEKVQQ